LSNYTKTVNFASKDNLNSGNPLKIVKGTEIDTEYNNIATAVATKTDNSAAAITGGTITGITDLAIADGGTGASTAAGALNNLLPSQTSAANKYLQSDGTNASWDAVSLSTADITGTLPVANGGTGVTSSTGTGNVVLSNSPTLVTPALGTPASGVATNLTGLPLTTGVTGTLPVANGGTGITSLGTGVATFLGTPSSANLASAVTDETGSGALVFANSPTLVTPALGTPASGVLTNATGLPISTGVSGLGTGIATFLATPSSANLISAVTDETGTGSLVFATSPTLVTPALGTPSALVGTNITGTASGLTAGNVTTNANLTGAVTSVGNATSLGSFSSANLLAALTDETGSGSAVFATSPTLVTPILGTPTSATLTNATGLPLTTGVTGLLPIANGGTATATPSIVAGTNVTVTGTWPNQTIAAAGGSPGGSTTQVQYNNAGAFGGITGATTNGTALTLVAPVLGTPASATLTNATGLPISTGVSGLGTGVATFLATPTSANLISAVSDETGSGSLVFATSPTLVTPILGTPTSGNFSTGTFTWPTFNQNTSGTAGGLSGTPNISVGTIGSGAITSTGNSTFAGTLLGISASVGRVTIGGAGQNNAPLYLQSDSTSGTRLRIINTGTGGKTYEIDANGVSNSGEFAVRNITASTVPLLINGTTNAVSLIGLVDISASTAGQIKFPATQNASSDANTLDDYEEGTWTPTQGGGLTVVGTFSSSGTYTKIGRQVNVRGGVGGSTTVSSVGSDYICSGLPFSAATGFYTATSAGTANNQGYTQGTVVLVITTGLVNAGSISATGSITFSAAYHV
jgi:hypothetical protein